MNVVRRITIGGSNFFPWHHTKIIYSIPLNVSHLTHRGFSNILCMSCRKGKIRKCYAVWCIGKVRCIDVQDLQGVRMFIVSCSVSPLRHSSFPSDGTLVLILCLSCIAKGSAVDRDNQISDWRYIFVTMNCHASEFLTRFYFQLLLNNSKFEVLLWESYIPFLERMTTVILVLFHAIT